MNRTGFLLLGSFLGLMAAIPAARAQETPMQRAQNVQAWFRESRLIEGSEVLVLFNPSLTAVKFKLTCYAADGEGKWWQVTVPGKDKTEIGSLEGWPGGFVPGEWCEASYDGTDLWTIKVR